MLLTGDAIDAAAAARFGLVNKVVPKEQLMEEARACAARIAANAPLAVQAAKELAVRAREMDRATGLRVEALTNRLLQCTEDAKEGPAAFAAKRPPRYKGH
jgi:E-phenylitaconyl-CoA hydratase